MRKRTAHILYIAILLGLLAGMAHAQATQPEPPSTTVWTNLSLEQMTLYVVGAGALLAAVMALVKKATTELIDWWFGAKRQIAERQKELEEQNRTIAQAVVTLTEANKQNDMTPDVSPAVESTVKAIATGSKDHH